MAALSWIAVFLSASVALGDDRPGAYDDPFEVLDEPLDEFRDECILLQTGIHIGHRTATSNAVPGSLTTKDSRNASDHKGVSFLSESQHNMERTSHTVAAKVLVGIRERFRKAAVVRQHRALLHDNSVIGLTMWLGEANLDGELGLSIQAGLISAVFLCGCILIFFVFMEEPKEADETDCRSNEGGRSRLDILDNAKFLLMALIVIDHAKGNAEKYWGWTTGVPELEAITQCHTRIYCFLSGVVAKDAPSKRGFRNIFGRLVLPIVLFSFVDPLLVLSDQFGAQMKTNLIVAYNPVYLGPAALMPIWYMHALVLWRLGGWAIYPLSPYCKFLVAFAVSAFGGYFVPLHLSALEPAFVYFVVYVLGQLCPMEAILKRLPQTWASISTGIVLLVMSTIWLSLPFVLAFMDDGSIPIWGWAGRAHQSDLSGALYWLRGLFRHTFELSRGFVFLFLCCPRSPGRMAEWGQRSLYAYLLNNIFLTDFCRLVHVPSSSTQAGQTVQIVILVTLSFSLVALLSTAWVRELFRPILEPVWLENFLCGVPETKGKTPVPSAEAPSSASAQAPYECVNDKSKLPK